MRTVQFLPLAREDFDQSFDWYAARSSDAAVRFASVIDAAIARIAENPGRFLHVDAIHQAISAKSFRFESSFDARSRRS